MVLTRLNAQHPHGSVLNDTAETMTPVPPISEALFTGKYKGPDQVISSTYSNAGSSTREAVKWRVTATCRLGPCDVSLRSLTGKYVVHLASLDHAYKGLITRKNWSKCPTDGRNIDANESFNLKVVKADVIGGRWIATGVSGSIKTQTLGGTACSDAHDESIVKVARSS
jgi:hypothetical protein